MVAGYHGLDTDLVTLRRRFQISLKGATLRQLMKVAEEIGFSGRPLRAELGDLSHVALPTILHWDLNHFVVLTRISHGVRGAQYHIQDPASGARAYSEAEFTRRFTGIVLELVRSERFQPRVERSRLRIGHLWSRIEGFWPAFRQIVLLSSVLQIIALVTPFFLQVSIDSVLPSADTDLLLILALGFGGVAIVSMLTSWVRALVLVRLGTALSYQVAVNLFRHLVRLPLPWFEKRHVGDVISRFGSAKSVTDLLSQGLIAVLIDGVMAVVTLGLMFIYSPALALLALAALVLVGGLRVGFFAASRQSRRSAKRPIGSGIGSRRKPMRSMPR
jgi:ATP-binding cassette subfamily B protein RaxB